MKFLVPSRFYRFFSVVVFGCLLSSFPLFPQDEGILEDGSLAEIDIRGVIKRGYLKVAMVEKDQPPFFSVDENGVLRGFDVDLSQSIAEALGVEPVFDRSAKAFNDLIPLVDGKKVDLVISKLSRTLARARVVRFTKPYVKFKQALLFNQLLLAKQVSDDNQLAYLIQHYDQPLGVIANSSYVNFAQTNFPEAEVREFPSWTVAVEALLNGDIVAIYRDELEIRKVVKVNKKSLLEVKTVLLKDKQDPISIAVHPEAPMMVEWLNLFLEENFPKALGSNYLLETYDF